MKIICGVFGILLLLAGSGFGAVNWFLTEFYLETVDWEGPMVAVNRYTWILNILGIGFGGVLIGIAAMLGNKANMQPHSEHYEG